MLLRESLILELGRVLCRAASTMWAVAPGEILEVSNAGGARILKAVCLTESQQQAFQQTHRSSIATRHRPNTFLAQYLQSNKASWSQKPRGHSLPSGAQHLELQLMPSLPSKFIVMLLKGLLEETCLWHPEPALLLHISNKKHEPWTAS